MAHRHGGALRCGFFGCGESEGAARVGDGPLRAVAGARPADELARREGVDPAAVDALAAARSRERAERRASPEGPLVAAGAGFERASGALGGAGDDLFDGSGGGGRVHVVESSARTVRLGVFDTTLPDVVEIEPGDVVSYPNTWSHFLGRMQPGVPIEQLARWRLEHPGVGPHSIVGPVGVRGARPGDALEIQYLRARPVGWAANFNNPGELGTGALPDLFADGQVRYFELDLDRMTTPFAHGIELPLSPFQGTLGVAPPPGWGGATSEVFSSVPPGPHGGNVDLRELSVGTRLFLPVWREGAKIYTGDSHALQGDGEVNLTALETAMEELRIRVLLHPGAGLRWPAAETPTHWIALGMDRSLDVAFRVALENAIDFLARRAGLTRLDAYALCALAVSFRITQVVDVNRGVHAMIPKSLFQPDLRARVALV